jgi:4-carboxymuconolactone decarboxylase
MLAATLCSICLVFGGAAAAEQAPTEGANPMSKSEDVRTVAPALQKYAQEVLTGDLWKRPGLSPRDRSIVTLAALIARDQIIELPYYLGLALDNGVKPAEISEIITHLAFYTGWANAMHAIPAARDVFKSRGIGTDQFPPASGPHFRSTRLRRSSGRHVSESSSARSRQVSSNTRQTCSFGISGSDRISLPVTAA